MNSMVVHELRQPLATIVNYVQSLLRLSDMHRPNSEAMMQKGLTTIRSEALKADEIVTKSGTTRSGRAVRTPGP